VMEFAGKTIFGIWAGVWLGIKAVIRDGIVFCSGAFYGILGLMEMLSLEIQLYIRLS
jgi:hypothetical protein